MRQRLAELSGGLLRAPGPFGMHNRTRKKSLECSGMGADLACVRVLEFISCCSKAPSQESPLRSVPRSSRIVTPLSDSAVVPNSDELCCNRTAIRTEGSALQLWKKKPAGQRTLVSRRAAWDAPVRPCRESSAGIPMANLAGQNVPDPRVSTVLWLMIRAA